MFIKLFGKYPVLIGDYKHIATAPGVFYAGEYDCFDIRVDVSYVQEFGITYLKTAVYRETDEDYELIGFDKRAFTLYTPEIVSEMVKNVLTEYENEIRKSIEENEEYKNLNNQLKKRLTQDLRKWIMEKQEKIWGLEVDD